MARQWYRLLTPFFHYATSRFHTFTSRRSIECPPFRSALIPFFSHSVFVECLFQLPSSPNGVNTFQSPLLLLNSSGKRTFSREYFFFWAKLCLFQCAAKRLRTWKPLWRFLRWVQTVFANGLNASSAIGESLEAKSELKGLSLSVKKSWGAKLWLRKRLCFNSPYGWVKEKRPFNSPRRKKKSSTRLFK